ncbi:hypothetical protein [Nostoc sp.]
MELLVELKIFFFSLGKTFGRSHTNLRGVTLSKGYNTYPGKILPTNLP